MTLANPSVSSVIKNYSDSQNAFLPKEVIIPLSQEYGVIFEPTVHIGDKVNEGDVIAVSKSKITEKSYIHSSIPGIVEDIVPCYCPNSKQSYGIKIKFGGSLSYLGKKLYSENAEKLLPSTIMQRLENHSVINTFKTAIPEALSIQLKKIKKGSNVVVRLFDEDPYRVTDSLIAKLYFPQILEATQILAKFLDSKGIVFAYDIKEEQNYKELYSNISIPNFRNLAMNIKRYPCGTPREIISAFNRNGLKKASNFSLSKSDLFIDASTVYEVYKAVNLSIPCVDKLVHFCGNSLFSSALLNVKIGMQLKDIVEQLGGFLKNPAMIIINGHINGSCVTNLEVPITKNVKSVEFINSQRKTDDHIYSCINCGNCRVACPVHISPDILHNNIVNYKLLPETFAASALGCIECGLCNTVCPSRLPLCQTVSYLKEQLSQE